jgi:hypothetical protein
MKELILFVTALKIVLLIIHECDACREGEWRMMPFLGRFSDRTQYVIFLYFHIPLFFFLLWYLYGVSNFQMYPLWISMNILVIVHYFMHLLARRSRTNVFHSVHSYVFIFGTAFCGACNLALMTFYR